jgi:nitrogen regulatory protein P-II 1
MKKIEAVIRRDKFNDVQNQLRSVGIGGMSVYDIKGFGRQRTPGKDFEDKVKLEIYVDDFQLDRIAELIIRAARTGNVGDGKLTIIPVDSVYRIRTGEEGPNAI